MTNIERIFEDDNSFEVSNRNSSVEFYVFGYSSEHTTKGEVAMNITEEASWDSQNVTFNLTREEATKLKEFLIKQGF